MDDIIPAEVYSLARSHAWIKDESAELHAVEIQMGAAHRLRPRLKDALHLWRVDLPGCEEIEMRRETEDLETDEPEYTNQMMSVFISQKDDGTFVVDSALYDEDPE